MTKINLFSSMKF